MSDGIYLNYSDFKAAVAQEGIGWRYREKPEVYEVFAVDGIIRYDTNVYRKVNGAYTVKGIVEADEDTNRTDFETNYKPTANQPYAQLVAPFSANTVEFRGDAIVNEECLIGSATSMDLLVSESRLLNGSIVYVSNASQGDYLTARVVDVDGAYYPAGTVLKEWITKWGVIPGHPMDLETHQAGVVPALVYLRIILTADNTGSSRFVTVNFRLNKKL